MKIEVEVDEISMQNIEAAVVRELLNRINLNELKAVLVKKVSEQVATDVKVHGAVNAGIKEANRKIAESVARKLNKIQDKEFVLVLKENQKNDNRTI